MKCPHCNQEVAIQLVSIAAPSRERGMSAQPREERKTADSTEIERLLGMIFDDDPNLTTWEQGYVMDLRMRFQKYGDKLFMSDKQMDRLRSIAAK